MTYIQIENNEYLRTVPSGNVEWNSTHFQPASTLTDEEKKMLGIVELIPSEPPDYNRDTEGLRESTPILVNGNWAQDWEIYNLTKDQIESAKQAKRRLIDKDIILSRITDEQLEAAMNLMTTRQKEQWRVPSKPYIYVDDANLLGLLKAIGADPEVVLAKD